MVKKVLFLQSTSEIGGTDITLLRILEALDQSRFEPHVVLPHEGPLSEAYRAAGCKVHVVCAMRQLSLHRGLGHLLRCALGYPRAVARIAGIVQSEGIDLIHTNTLHNPYGFLAASLAGKPHVWHIREIVVQLPWLRWLERKVAIHFSRRLIVMSDAIAQMFFERGDGPPPNLVKVYDGVDLALFHPRVSGSRIRRELGVREATPLIGVVSRLDPVKGLDLFLEVVARVLRARPDARFWVCGGEIPGHEGYEGVLRKQAQALGIEHQAFFTSWRYRFRDIPEVYGALNICLACPRYPEPYGLWCVEAMASGVPIVTFAQGGPLELCVDGVTSLLVPFGDLDRAAQATLSLLNDAEQAQAMGRAGRRRAEQFFDRRRCVRELETVYESIL